VRILRDLSLKYPEAKRIAAVKALLGGGTDVLAKCASPQGEELGILQYLAANGLWTNS